MEIKKITIVALILILISSILLIKKRKIKIVESYEVNIKRVNSLLDSINNNVEKMDALEITLFEKSGFVDSIAVKKERNRIKNLVLKQQLAKIENLETDSEEHKRLHKNLARNHTTLIENREERFKRYQRERYNKSMVSPVEFPREVVEAIQRKEEQLITIKRRLYYSESKIEEIYIDLKKITLSSNNVKKNKKELRRINEELEKILKK